MTIFKLAHKASCIFSPVKFMHTSSPIDTGMCDMFFTQQLQM